MALNIKCGYQFKSPAPKGESKAEKEALEKLRTFDFKIAIPSVSARLSRRRATVARINEMLPMRLPPMRAVVAAHSLSH